MILFNYEKIENTEIEIYFKYRHLDTGEIADLFHRLDRLYKSLLKNSYRRVYFSEKYDAPFRNFLEIDSINTGQSIRIKFKEGWKPEFKFKDIKISKKLGIPAILLHLLLIGVQNVNNIYNDHLDAQLKELEIRLKQMEFYEKIEEKERNRYKKTFYARPYQKQADEAIQVFMNNENIYFIEINGTVIKNEE